MDDMIIPAGSRRGRRSEPEGNGVGTKPNTLPQEVRNAVVNHILRYELYRHRRLVHSISAKAGAKFLTDTKKNTNTWEVVFFICRSWLEGNVPTASDIFLATGLSKGTATTCINRLEQTGLIHRSAGEEDRRQRFIHLSEPYVKLLDAFVLESYQEFLSLTPPAAKAVDSGADQVETEITEFPDPSFLTHLSHDLRSQLNTIIGFSEAIKDEQLGRLHPSGYIEYANDIHRAARQLSDLVGDMIDLSQFRASGSIQIETGSIDAVELVESCRDDIYHEASRRNVSVNVISAPDIPRIDADAKRMKRAVWNLLHNAVLFSPTGEDVVMEVRNSSDRVEFIVSDRGPGIAENALGGVTAPFVRHTPADSPYEMSAGIGLAIAKTIAEAHQGSLGIENQPEGGTRAWISLPIPGNGN